MVCCAFSLENVLLATAACNFRHRNFKKRCEATVFCTFSRPNVLFTTAACNFWFLLWAPTSAPAALTALLFDWPDTRIIEKTQPFATSLTLCIFFLLTFALLHLLSSDFTASHLLFICFSTLHIVGSLLFKFPMTSIHFNALKKSIHTSTWHFSLQPESSYALPALRSFLEGHFSQLRPRFGSFQILVANLLHSFCSCAGWHVLLHGNLQKVWVGCTILYTAYTFNLSMCICRRSSTVVF